MNTIKICYKSELVAALKKLGCTPSPLPQLPVTVGDTRIVCTHNLEIPRNAGKGLTEWIAICKTCGAKWRCYYGRYGLEWRALNDQARSSDAVSNN